MFLFNFFIFLKTTFLEWIIYYHILLLYLIIFIIAIKGITKYIKYHNSRITNIILVLFSMIILVYWNFSVPSVIMLFSFFYMIIYKIWLILIYFTNG